MKSFWGFVKKEFIHIFRDKRSMIVLFGIPILQMILFGFVITNDIKDIKIAVLDKSNDNISNKIINKITSSGYFINVQKLDNEKQIEEAFKEGKVKEVIVFESSFQKNFEKENSANIQLIADATDVNMANLVTSYTMGIIQSFVNAENADIKMPLKISTETRMYYNENLESVYMFVPGTMAMILMLISAFMTSISIVREKESGTMEILLVSSLKPYQIIIGKVIPYVLLSFFNAVSILVLSNFVFGLPIQGNIAFLLLECLVFIIMALSLGIFISTITDSLQTAMMLSMFVLMLPTILLSGFIFPIENMPVALQWFCQLMPPRWFIVIIKNIMLKGTGFETVWFETSVLLFMTVFFLLLSVKKFQIRLA